MQFCDDQYTDEDGNTHTCDNVRGHLPIYGHVDDDTGLRW